MKRLGYLITLCLVFFLQESSFAKTDVLEVVRGIRDLVERDREHNRNRNRNHENRDGRRNHGRAGVCDRNLKEIRNFCTNSTRTYQEETTCFRSELSNQNEFCAPLAEQIVSRCQRITQTWEQETLCYRGRIDQGENYQWNVMDGFRCAHHNVFGSYVEGGGCNVFGCYRPGGGCNTFGCFKPGGKCGVRGCINGEDGSFTCVN